ncbi:hypothetical protein R6231_13765 [Bacillus cytotoxicus]|uniref:hypothetical protein n=1 Tax=Bacillus cytotoxicus TaxID=580165 RepID=UPI00115523EF|nr:hypothetical protein [Bacillus cytotoxicus]MDH2869447.1 hypothetical protein [Bacillus cytotoxicus]MDH2873602.1 hypothetical protein [Bacillus cytotoxicus]MDH2876640.1 hypothetical protein [Bacillus cytotoxicus]MDH2921214.1 hypothetical protein [Bacillus cytotoxicus]QTR68874.1 hypothetical protein JC776_09750 [Bacillus cytotoxicus]
MGDGWYIKFNISVVLLAVNEIISALEPLLSAQNELYRRLNRFYRRKMNYIGVSTKNIDESTNHDKKTAPPTYQKAGYMSHATSFFMIRPHSK